MTEGADMVDMALLLPGLPPKSTLPSRLADWLSVCLGAICRLARLRGEVAEHFGLI